MWVLLLLLLLNLLSISLLGSFRISLPAIRTRVSGTADEEPVDPKKYLEERCKPQCVKPLYEYERCVKRVESDDTGHKHCTGQYFDYLSCIDKCVAPKLFEKLK
ncbi:hypothetical protein BRADI_4g24760v3 [Brachypodium distachyon]|uniref:Complex III subunit VI n=1 Tax=Brachypodium distachyon TaxID=15368 RepID=A0A0Q3IT18_BRADI|nr:hypothetical protein BRADI_4g24760v3 [Brachypodium distachyon]